MSQIRPRHIDQHAFTVVGISARTNNAKEMSGKGIIAGLWQRFMYENLVSRIPNVADSAILALYTDYVSDKDGDYTFIIGARVRSTDSIPEGMISHVIPSGRYAVLTTECGQVWKVVPAAWQRIWEIPTTELARTYRTDYEIYDARAADPDSSVVELHVGIR